MRSCAVLIGIVTVFLGAALHGQELIERGDPRVYTGENLEAVGLPIGGIGTGNIWIAGDGGLPVWQIFNNLTGNAHVPDSFLAVRACAEGGEPVVCALQADAPEGFESMEVKSFRGDYPMAWLDFSHETLPVEVSLEAFNPMIPLNLKDSAIPCAIFRVTARNPGDVPVQVSLAAMLQNAVGYNGYDPIDGIRFWGYGVNQNTLLRAQDYMGFILDVQDKKGSQLQNPMRLCYHGPESRWFNTCENLERVRIDARDPSPEFDALWIADCGPELPALLLDNLVRVIGQGGLVLLEAPDRLFQVSESVAAGEIPGWVPFEDFESDDYADWTMEGTAFAEKPAAGTTPGQQPVAGFEGKGLVNSYQPDDLPTGKITSRAFLIEKPYIGFLVGGGGHEEATCIRLRVGDEIVRSTTGKNREALEPAQWDVRDFMNREAVIEIVDAHTGGWGHINVDQIVFSAEPPIFYLGKLDAFRAIAEALPFAYRGDRTDFEKAGWEELASRYEEVDDGEDFDRFPALVSGPLGQGNALIFINKNMAWPHAVNRLATACGNRLAQAGRGLPVDNAAYGNLCLAVRTLSANFHSEWKETPALAADLLDDGRIESRERSRTSPLGTTLNCALSVPFVLAPGAEQHADFVISWSFPNLERFGHRGNAYTTHFDSAWSAASYVCEEFDRLRDETLRYHDTLYETNLPFWMLDCLSSQSCIFRTVNCFHAARHAETGKPYFAGYEGCYGCCPLNCTHVWNYAQTHARLYPELGRNLRWYDFVHYLKEDGETMHRQHADHGAFIDGQCAVIAAALREHQLSPNAEFLKEIWPGVKPAMEWLIRKIDADEDGVNDGLQWNTYDVATSGAHTFIGSQYLSALAAAERMARVMNDSESADRWAEILRAGSENQDARLFNGKYYIQAPGEETGRDYNSGCHSDQLLGLWWAHMLDTEQPYPRRLYPADHVRIALRAVMEYNFREEFTGFTQRPRRYVPDDEGGLLNCTWPMGGRPDSFIEYADEIWTGIEYSTAALMMYEGLIEEAFKIVHTARGRYDGRLREGLNSGPGGNPFNELECGRFYARALSSWSLLLAAQGFIYDGPACRIGFLPRWRPEDHKSFFSAAEGWGLFEQQRDENRLEAGIEVRYGRLALEKIVLGGSPGQAEPPAVTATLDGKTLTVSSVDRSVNRVEVTLAPKIDMTAGQKLCITMSE